jgi:hypothetical protein
MSIASDLKKYVETNGGMQSAIAKAQSDFASNAISFYPAHSSFVAPGCICNFDYVSTADMIKLQKGAITKYDASPIVLVVSNKYGVMSGIDLNYMSFPDRLNLINGSIEYFELIRRANINKIYPQWLGIDMFAKLFNFNSAKTMDFTSVFMANVKIFEWINLPQILLVRTSKFVKRIKQ